MSRASQRFSKEKTVSRSLDSTHCPRLIEQEAQRGVAGPATLAIAVDGVLEHRQQEEALALLRLAAAELAGQNRLGHEGRRHVAHAPRPCGPIDPGHGCGYGVPGRD